MANSPRDRGNRLKMVREKILGVSRPTFSQRYGVPFSTLQKWEDGIGKGINNSAAEKISSVYQSLGIDCTPEWILYDSGKPPAPLLAHHYPLAADKNSNYPLDEVALIIQELRFFCQLHKNTLDAIVNDDAMEPCFKKGDYVAGVRFFNKDIEKLVNYDCIVQTIHGDVLIRHLAAIQSNQHYTLTCLNHKSTTKPKKRENVEIASAAPIIWIRRPNPPLK